MINPPSRSRRGRPRKWPRIVESSGVAVRVYRRKLPSGSWGFQVANPAGGKRRLDSYADEASAIEAAEKVAKQIATGEAIVAEMNRADVTEYRSARLALDPLGLRLVPSIEVLVEAVKLAGGLPNVLEAAESYSERRRPVEPKTVTEVVAMLLAARNDRSPRHKADLKNRLGRFAKAFQINIASVSGPQIQAWLDGLRLSARSRRNYRSAISNLFCFAQKRGLIVKGENPALDTEQIPARSGRIHVLTPVHMGKLLNAATPETLPVLVLCGFAGLRTAEALRLRWDQVDLAQRHVVVGADQAKTASRRIAPLSENACEWLAPYANRTGPIWTGSIHSFIPARVKVARAAGVKWHANVLRHSAISYRVASTNDVAKVALESGNSTGVIFRCYRELVKAADAERWFAIRPALARENVVVMPAAANG